MLKYLVLAICGLYIGSSASAQTSERPFTIGTLLKPEWIMPSKQYSGGSSTIQDLLFPPVLYVGFDGRVRCTLCKEVPTVEIRKGTPTTFIISMELKKDLKWGDGKPILAKDVKFTLEQMAKADYPKGSHPILPIRRIELDKDQDRKITLVLRHRRSDAFQLFAISLFPSHKAKELEGLSTNPERSFELLKDPAYSYGTYKVAAASPSDFQLVRNDKTEWETKPEEPLRIRFFKTKEELILAMKSASIDQSDDIAWKDYRDIKASWPEVKTTFEMSSKPSDSMQVLILNLKSPILVNPQLRQALFYAIDREALNKMQFDGLGVAGNGLLTDPFAKRLDRERQAPFNKKLASELLDQSGWERGADGIRTSEGQRFVLSLICPKERLDPRWVEIVQADLKKVGIELQYESPEPEEYLKKIVGERRFKDLACVTWSLPQLSIPNNLFHSLAIPSRENHYFGSNYSGWDAHVVDKLLDNMLRETELHHFVRQFGRLDKQFMSDLPGIPLVYEPQVRFVLKNQSRKPTEELSKVLQSPHQIKL